MAGPRCLFQQHRGAGAEKGTSTEPWLMEKLSCEYFTQCVLQESPAAFELTALPEAPLAVKPQDLK